MDGSNADFALHMEGSHVDLAPHMEQRHSFRDKIISKTATFANFQREIFKTINILGVYMTYVTTFYSTNILRESTFKYIELISYLGGGLPTVLQRRERAWLAGW